MRIALLTTSPSNTNGIAGYAQHFAGSLKQHGVEVSLPLAGHSLTSCRAADQWVGSQDWRGVDVVHAEIGGGRVCEFLALEALGRLARPHRPRILSATAHDPERLIWRPPHRAWQWFEQSKALPRPLLQSLALLVDPLTLRAERRLAATLDGIVTLTETGASCLSQRLRVPRERIAVINHGTPQIAAATLPPLKPLRLLYFGFIYRGKGIEDLLDAVARVRARLPGLRGALRLTLAGGTAPEIAFGRSGNYLDELKAQVRSLGLDDVVDWQLDVPEEDIASVVQQHHVVVLPYRESRKLALLGQMRGTSGALAWSVACGRGVITSNARSFAEEISAGNGLAYLQGDVSGLASCIGKLIRNPALIQQWAAAAAQLANQRAWPRTAERFVQCFDGWRKADA